MNIAKARKVYIADDVLRNEEIEKIVFASKPGVSAKKLEHICNAFAWARVELELLHQVLEGRVVLTGYKNGQVLFETRDIESSELD